jgi:transcriptional regulator with XRE-family HTH domain
MKITADVSFIKSVCKKHNIKISGLCDKLGISPGVVSYWKRGRKPSLDNMLKISRFFNMTIDHFIIVDEEG